MARSADAAATVLESLRLLHDIGADLELESGDLIAAFEQIGISGFSLGEEPYFLMVGTMLRLLLRHATTDATAMFEAARADLETLGQDIDDAKFSEIVAQLEEDE